MFDERSQLIILLDSSTSYEPGMPTGPSVCFWAAYIYRPATDEHPVSKHLPEEKRYENAVLMEALNKKPVRSGAVYNNHDSPARMFYDGIIRSLDSCFYLLRREETSETIIIGNDQHVIRQINGQSSVDEMEPLYNQVMRLKDRYVSENRSIEFRYIHEDDFPLYRKIHALTGRLQEVMSSLL